MRLVTSMMPSLAVGFSVLMTSGATLAQSAPAASQSPGADIELSTAVRQELGNLTLPKVSERLKSIKFAVESGSTVFFYERFENGLWGVAQLTAYSRGNVVQRQATLSGLIVLGGTLNAISEQEIPVLGRAPFGIPLKHTTTGTYQTENLRGDLATLANPTAGSKFSYELSMRSQTGSRPPVTRVVRASCVVESKADAGALHPNLRGSFLPVSCEETRDGKESSRRYAYLIESALYVPTSISGGPNQGIFKFAEVQYVEPK